MSERTTERRFDRTRFGHDLWGGNTYYLQKLYPRFFLNIETCESTRSRRIAKSWLKAGSDVEIWFNGYHVKAWEAV